MLKLVRCSLLAWALVAFFHCNPTQSKGIVQFDSNIWADELSETFPHRVEKQPSAIDTKEDSKAKTGDDSSSFKLSLYRCANGALRVYDAVVADVMSDPELLTTIRSDLEDIAGELYRLQTDLGAASTSLFKTAARSRYVEAELVIKENLRRLIALSQSPNSARLRTKFFEESEQLEPHLQVLIDGLNGGDILHYARESTRCHSRKFRQQTDQFKELLNAGLYVQSIFVKMRHIAAENEPFRKQLEATYKEAEKRIDDQYNECQSADDVAVEIRQILRDNAGIKNEKVADRLLSFLEDKYTDKSWLVLVYDAVNGFEDQAVSDTFTTVYREGGKNAAVLPIDTRTKFNPRVRDILTKYNVGRPQDDAEKVFDELKVSISKLTSVNGNNNGLAVVKRSADLGTAWSRRLDPYLQKYDSLTVLGLFYLPVISQDSPSPQIRSGQFGGSRYFATPRLDASAFSQDEAASDDDSCSSGDCGQPPSCGKKLVAYYSSWSDSLLTVKQASRLTHIIYAFIEMKSDGSLQIGSADPTHTTDPDGDRKTAILRLDRLNEVKKKVPGLKTLFAVGGWENSQYFSAAVASESMQENFIRDMKAIVNTYDFDGIDIDWEYPVTGGANNGTLDDKDNYVKFLRRLRTELKSVQSQKGRSDDYLITIASAAGSWVLEVGYDLDNIVDAVDWINVMTYDYYGAWDSKWGAYTGPVSPLYYGTPKGFSGKMNADYTLKYYVCRTSKPEKILMGLPFYGRYWYHVADAIDNADPLWRLAEDKDGNSFPNATSYEGGFAGWREVKSDWLKRSGYTKTYHTKTQTPYLWNPKERILLAYEDVQSLKEKIKYANSHNLGGVMFWAIDLDDDQDTLLKSISDGSLCAPTQQIKYKCNPLRERRWWTFEDDPKKAGMCGKSAPLFNGYYPVCDPDDPGYACCGKWGYCGDGPESCSCPTCVDYGNNPELVLQEPVKPPGSVVTSSSGSSGVSSSASSSAPTGCSWHTLDAPIEPGQPRCGYSGPDKDGLPATCNGDDPAAHCCSPFGYCGTGTQFCNCPDCVDFKKNPGYCYPVKEWWTWDDGADKGGRCGPGAPLIKGKTPICNPNSNTAYCCSKWGNCGSGAGFCECDGCVNFKKNPDFRWS